MRHVRVREFIRPLMRDVLARQLVRQKAHLVLLQGERCVSDTGAGAGGQAASMEVLKLTTGGAAGHSPGLTFNSDLGTHL